MTSKFNHIQTKSDGVILREHAVKNQSVAKSNWTSIGRNVTNISFQKTNRWRQFNADLEGFGLRRDNGRNGQSQNQENDFFHDQCILVNLAMLFAQI